MYCEDVYMGESLIDKVFDMNEDEEIDEATHSATYQRVDLLIRDLCDVFEEMVMEDMFTSLNEEIPTKEPDFFPTFPPDTSKALETVIVTFSQSKPTPTKLGANPYEQEGGIGHT